METGVKKIENNPDECVESVKKMQVPNIIVNKKKVASYAVN